MPVYNDNDHHVFKQIGVFRNTPLCFASGIYLGKMMFGSSHTEVGDSFPLQMNAKLEFDMRQANLSNTGYLYAKIRQ